MRGQLRRIIKLIRKTGDRVIIFDGNDPDNTYVAMSLNEYENLIFGGSEARGLTKKQLLDKINRDIAIWKNKQNYGDLSRFNTDKSGEMYNNEELGNKKEEESKRNNWAIPSDRRNTEGADEEDRQYLEEVAF